MNTSVAKQKERAQAEQVPVRRPFRYLVLVAFFVLSFAVPFFFALPIGDKLVPDLPEEGGVADKIFPTALRVDSPRKYLQAKHSPGIDIKGGDDVLFVIWVSLLKLPENGERIGIFSKIDPSSRTKKGYALVLDREGDKIRPSVYWQNGGGRGNWYRFSELGLQEKSWQAFALSFREGRFLGLHTASRFNGHTTDLRLLGGYDLGEIILPQNDTDLFLPAHHLGKFRGFIGPVAIIAKPNLSEDFEETITSLIEKPLEMPSEIGPEPIKLWMIGNEPDQSIHKQEVLLRKK